MCAVFAWWGHRAMIRERLACQSRRGLRDLGRIAGGRSHTRRGVLLVASGAGSAMRGHLLATTAAAALLAAMPARAQDATWSTAPGSSDFNTAANWTPATVPTGTAFFGASNITSLSFSANTAVGGWTFNAGAPAYTFTVPSGPVLTFNGAGISGGDAAIINNGSIQFQFFSTAGNANITNNGLILFLNSSTSGTATISTATGAATLFTGSSTAGLARLITAAGGFVDFTQDTSANLTAGSIEGAGTY